MTIAKLGQIRQNDKTRGSIIKNSLPTNLGLRHRTFLVKESYNHFLTLTKFIFTSFFTLVVWFD